MRCPAYAAHPKSRLSVLKTPVFGAEREWGRPRLEPLSCVSPRYLQARRWEFPKNVAVWPGNGQIKEKIEFVSIQRQGLFFLGGPYYESKKVLCRDNAADSCLISLLAPDRNIRGLGCVGTDKRILPQTEKPK